ncbi:MAG: AAA family ATPase [Nanoarchaeota archaeon]|nr:AAA family ATPase [Nanoarchaeota archaeon]
MVEGKIFGVVALKGGVGKTTVCANLGTALAIEFDKKVLIIDANFSTPHLGLHVGIVNPEHSLHKIIEDEYSVFEGIYEHALGFHIIPGMLAPEGLDYNKLKEKIEPLKEYYDYILVDSSPSLNQEMAATMSASDEVLVVSSPDYPTLSSTLHAIKIAKEQGTDIRGIILNKVRKKRFELNPKDISEASDVKVLASIPDEIKVQAALAKMIPIVSFSPTNEVSHIYKKLAADLIGEKYRRSLFGRKKKKKVKEEKDEKE